MKAEVRTISKGKFDRVWSGHMAAGRQVIEDCETGVITVKCVQGNHCYMLIGQGVKSICYRVEVPRAMKDEIKAMEATIGVYKEVLEELE